MLVIKPMDVVIVYGQVVLLSGTNTTRIVLIHDDFMVTVFETVTAYRYFDGALTVSKRRATSVTV